MKIAELRVENVKRIRAVEMRVDSQSLVIIGGKNGAGKSSLIDAIEYAVLGGRSLPEEPIRQGARRAEIEVTIGDGDDALRVRKRITRRGAELIVSAADGRRLPSPQKVLDALYTRVSFDPLAFARMDSRSQVEVLRQVIGVDTSELDAEAREIYERRRDVNREAKAARASVDAIDVPADAPEEEVSVAELFDELERRRAVNAENAAKLHAVTMLGYRIDELEVNRDDAVRTVERLSQELEEAKAAVSRLGAELDDARSSLAVKREAVTQLVDLDEAEIREHIQHADHLNEAARRRREKNERIAAVRELERSSAALTRRLDEVTAAKRRLLDAVEWPVDGLSFDEGGVALDGVPFSQASTAQQLRASVAIALAQRPTLRVILIRDGSLLDDDHLALLGRIAEENDAQLWIERVGDGDEVSVVIEDGMIRGEEVHGDGDGDE